MVPADVMERIQHGTVNLSRERIARIESGVVFLRGGGGQSTGVAADVLEAAGEGIQRLAPGTEVLVARCPDGRPIVLGVIADRIDEGRADAMVVAAGSEPPPDSDGIERIEGKRLVVSAGEELLLECGSGSIRITADGKIIIRGEHLLSRARGTNRIKGGSVAIN